MKRSKASDENEVVYFAQAGGVLGPLKIGTSRSGARARLKTLQCGNHEEIRLVATQKGGPELEAAYHRVFAHDRRIGEWFDASPALLLLIGQSPVSMPLVGRLNSMREVLTEARRLLRQNEVVAAEDLINEVQFGLRDEIVEHEHADRIIAALEEQSDERRAA